MDKFINSLIEYQGIDHCSYNDVEIFKQTNIDNTFYLPIQKPDIEQIVKVRGTAKIDDYKIVKTPIGTSLEGQKVTGFKIMACGEIVLQYDYVANEDKQSMHSVCNTIPFCDYIVMPEDFNEFLTISPLVLIEDIYSEQLDFRCIYNNITLIIIMDLC